MIQNFKFFLKNTENSLKYLISSEDWKCLCLATLFLLFWDRSLCSTGWPDTLFIGYVVYCMMSFKVILLPKAWWHMFIIQALQRVRQENC